jgi:hypothetical protein
MGLDACLPRRTARMQGGQFLAYDSAIWQHNGLIDRNQDRQTEVKSLQEACNDANDNGNGG